MRITLKPFGDIDEGLLAHLSESLRGIGEVEVAPGTPVPEDAYDGKRKQHRASAFLQASREEPGDRVLGITGVDLYEPGLNFVFGLATVRDRYAVISTARLDGDGPGRLHERASKEAIHELGHTLGLDHHPDPSCVMFFSNNLGDTDRKSGRFCASCGSTADFTLKRLRR